MKNACLAGAAAVLMLAGVTGVDAQPANRPQIHTDEENGLKTAIDATNQVCGSNIIAQFNWQGAQEGKLSEYSASSFCDNAMGGIRFMCETDAGKAAVKQKLKTMICGFGAKRSVTLKDGVLNYEINFDAAGDGEYVFEYLKKNL